MTDRTRHHVFVTEPADPSRDSRRDPVSPTTSDSGGSHTSRDEIVDAELVDEPAASSGTDTSARGPNPADDEEFRQYQQFREFQKFQEWQRQQGTAGGQGTSGEPGQPGPTAPPPQPQVTGSTPWWKRVLRLLRYKWVRRLLYVLIILIALYAYIQSLFGGSDDSNTYQPGQPPPPNPQPVLQTEPKQAVITLYDYVATKPGSVCILLSDSAREAFAQHHSAADCDSAVRKLNERVENESAYKNPKLGEDAVETVHNPELGGPADVPNDARVRACEITVEGGPKLGDFGLSREDTGGWIIDGYEPASPCP